MSPPALNARPAPVSTIARASRSWLIAVSTRGSSACISRSNAFMVSGRLRVTIRSGPSDSTRMTGFCSAVTGGTPRGLLTRV